MSRANRHERVREAAKREIMGAFAENSDEGGVVSNKMDGTNAEHVSAMLDDLKNQFNQRMEALKADFTSAKNKQQQAFASGMVKLPKNIKSMKVSEFDAIYKCDLLSIVMNIRSDQKTTDEGKNHVPLSKKRDRIAAETPDPVRPRRRDVETPSRTVRRGEALYSKNGSPLDTTDEGALVATVTKKRRGETDAGGVAAAAANFDINVGDGRYISLTDPMNVNELDDDMKSTALTQLKVLHDQMARVMQQLEM